MLNYISEHFSTHWGPLRLLSSDLLTIVLGTTFCFFACLWLLPRFAPLLPKDRGRAFAVDADKSVGKPMGAGIIFVLIFIAADLIFIRWRFDTVLVLPLIAATSFVGLIDDRTGGLSELKLATLDLMVAVLAAIVLTGTDQSVAMWLPVITGTFYVPWWISVWVFTATIWIAINATNCSDGVDGLSGSLSIISLVFLGFLLYGVLGDRAAAGYLLVPFDEHAGLWAHPAFLMVGCIAGYLWYNAPPSSMLMGDAGSRPIGFLVGILVCASHNVALIVVVSFVVLVNGTTGLFKVAVKRMFNVLLFGRVRFPLHDHFRKEVGWSGTQVLFRFILVHLFVSSLLYAILLKVR